LYLPDDQVDVKAKGVFVEILERRAQAHLATMIASWVNSKIIFPDIGFLWSDACVIVELRSLDYRSIPLDLR
jgi:hypothetical protein